MLSNMPSGYHRDMQLLKEKLFPAIQSLKDCLRMMQLMLSNVNVKENILEDDIPKPHAQPNFAELSAVVAVPGGQGILL